MELTEVGWAQIEFIWLTIRTKVGPSEHSNELSDSRSLKVLLMSSLTAKLLACQHRLWSMELSSLVSNDYRCQPAARAWDHIMSPNAVCQKVTGGHLSSVSFAEQTGHLIPMQQPQSYLVHKACVCNFDFKVMVTNTHPEHHHILCYTNNILMLPTCHYCCSQYWKWVNNHTHDI
jgi:hypothetical protein